MKTSKLIIAAILSICLCACEHPTVSVEKEKAVIDAIYECLELTPNQVADKMETIGFHRRTNPSTSSWKYDAYSDIDVGNEGRVLIGVSSMNDTLSGIGYNIYLTHDTDPAAHFRLVSDIIATYGYSDWKGTYRDASTEDALQIAESRADLCAHIRSDYLSDSKTTQNYSENFIYTHTDGSRWSGEYTIYCEIWPKNGGKDVFLSYTLTRIQ